MAKGAITRTTGMKKAVKKVIHSSLIRTNIPAGMASPGPPLGPMLGQRGLNISAFCKDFNAKTAHYIEGTPLPCRIKVNPDRSYELTVHNPPSTFLLLQAAGLQKGAMNAGKEIAGKITLKHIYEIAKIKAEDRPLHMTPLKQICELMIGTARSCGIKVVKGPIDSEEYGKFLEERKEILKQQAEELREIRESKLLRK